MNPPRVVALSGGIGGAKLALGLYRILPPEALTVIVNTGDDFDHLGLRICPDLDTCLYTLAGIENPELGWGRRDETWTCMTALAQLGGETWFRLGDADIALHLERTRRLAAGETLSQIIADLARRLAIVTTLLPATDAPLRTRLITAAGELAFQDYFVRRRCEPAVRAVRFEGAAAAQPAEAVLRALAPGAADVILICPSNPYLSVDPILAIAGMRDLLRAANAPVIAVTPVIGGRAVKGPTTKIMAELGIDASPLAIARHYRGLIDGFVLDVRDQDQESGFQLPVLVTDTLMKTLDDRERLARETLVFAAQVRGGARASA